MLPFNNTRLLTEPLNGNPGLRSIIELLEADFAALTEANTESLLYRDYFEGGQAIIYTTPEFIDAFGTEAAERFNANWSEVVVSAVEERLNMLSMDSDDDPMVEAIWNTILANDLSYLEEETYNGALVESRSVIFTWPIENEDGEITGVRLDPVRADKVWVSYQDGDPRRPIRAMKAWLDNAGTLHATLYTNSFLYKFRSTMTAETYNSTLPLNQASRRLPAGHIRAWERRQPEGEEWPLPNPYGRVPLAEFTNRYNRSEIQNVIPYQDLVNKTLIDMITTGSYTAHSQKYMVTSNEEPDGGWISGPDKVWQIQPEESIDGNPLPVTIGQFDSSDPDVFIKVISMGISLIGAQSRTPGYYFLVNVDSGGRGDAPSGAALRVADTGLIKKIEALHERFPYPWRQVAKLIHMTLNDFTLTPQDEDKLNKLSINWAHPMSHHRGVLIEEAIQMVNDLKVPHSIAWAHAGLTAAEIKTAEAALGAQEREQNALPTEGTPTSIV